MQIYSDPAQGQRSIWDTSPPAMSKLAWEMLHYWEAYGWAFVTERDARQEVQ